MPTNDETTDRCVAQPAEDRVPEAKASEPQPQPQSENSHFGTQNEFYQLKCTDERPPGFYEGRFVRSDYPTVIGRRLMRR